MSHRRYMAIDLGRKRTGLALGDTETGLASPLTVLHEPDRERLLATIATQIHRHTPDALVIGLPLNMDGTEGPQAKAARAFGDALGRLAQLPMHYQDERLTSFAAEEHLSQSGRTHREKANVRDALAAVEILRDFLSTVK